MAASHSTATHICAIHQPNFFPWLGFFDKIRRVEAFVFLDAVDYPRSGSKGMGSPVNRVKIALKGKEHTVGVPLQRAPLGTPINCIEIDESQRWRQKLLRTLAQNYGRAKNFESAMALIEPLVGYRDSNLSTFNIHAITTIASALGCVSTRFFRQSSLNAPGASTELLINLAKAVHCNAYLAGAGSSGYQKDELFAKAGVMLIYQGFKPEPYEPRESFVPGLSIIDYLMHDGRPLEVWAREQGLC